MKGMTASEIVGDATLLLVGLSAFIEITPIKINPLSALLKWIGRAINGEVMAEVKQLKKELNEMKETEDMRNAKAARSRVLRFGDELNHEVHHTKEHFDDVLRDITDYNNYCASHPNFENDQMHETAAYVKSIYRECLKNHSFK
jgi:hypothetical protein